MQSEPEIRNQEGVRMQRLVSEVVKHDCVFGWKRDSNNLCNGQIVL